MAVYEFEEQDKQALVDEISRLTQAAVEADRFFRVQVSRDGEWWKAVVTVGDAA